MKYNLEYLHQYAKQWYSYDSWTDLNMAIDSGYTELALKMLDEAGAIDSNNCYEDAKPIERAIEKLLKKYTKKQHKKDLDACFKNAIVYVNPKTNEHAFIKNSDVDYLQTDKDMRSYGYIPEKEYYSKE